MTNTHTYTTNVKFHVIDDFYTPIKATTAIVVAVDPFYVLRIIHIEIIITSWSFPLHNNTQFQSDLLWLKKDHYFAWPRVCSLRSLKFIYSSGSLSVKGWLIHRVLLFYINNFVCFPQIWVTLIVLSSTRRNTITESYIAQTLLLLNPPPPTSVLLLINSTGALNN